MTIDTIKNHVALYGFQGVIGEAETLEEAIRIASERGCDGSHVDFYDAEDGPRVQGYEADGKGVWIIG